MEQISHSRCGSVGTLPNWLHYRTEGSMGIRFQAWVATAMTNMKMLDPKTELKTRRWRQHRRSVFHVCVASPTQQTFSCCNRWSQFAFSHPCHGCFDLLHGDFHTCSPTSSIQHWNDHNCVVRDQPQKIQVCVSRNRTRKMSIFPNSQIWYKSFTLVVVNPTPRRLWEGSCEYTISEFLEMSSIWPHEQNIRVPPPTAANTSFQHKCYHQQG